MPTHRPSSLCSLVLYGVVCVSLMLGAPAKAWCQTETGGKGFRELLDKRQKETLQAVAEYVASNPMADDVDQASAWLFESALATGMERETIATAEKYLVRQDADPGVRLLAQRALCLGMARSGRLPEAVGLFDSQLRGARFQPAGPLLDFAHSLSAKARLAGDMAAAREVYEKLSSAFPLNPQVSEIAEGRLGRMELIGKPAPRVGANDLEGKRVDLGDYNDKVVLVDFWATNCPPCLEEFPNLRQLYKEFQPKGFEIIGVSFDESPDIVEAFRSRAKLPWRMVMNESPEGLVSRRFSTKTIPALFLIDRKGNVAQADVRGNDLREAVKKLVEGK